MRFIDEKDGKLVLHDWEENKSPYLKRLESERERRKRHAIKLSENSTTTRAAPVETKQNKTIGAQQRGDKLRLHDWDDNKSPYLKRLESDRARRKRCDAKKSENLTTSRESRPEIKPNQTKPDQTIDAQQREQGGEHQDDMIQNTGDHAADIAAFHDKLRNMLAEHKL